MGACAIRAAKAAHRRLRRIVGLSSGNARKGLALTPVIGVNDVDNETFTLSDAARVRSFAEEKDVAWVSMWPTARDQECPRGKSSTDRARSDCGGVRQKAGVFAEVFSG